MERVRILVLGATGFIGKNVVKELNRNKYRVSCFVRKTSNINFLKQLDSNLTFFYGDIKKKNTLLKAMKNIDIGINCSGLNSF